MPKTNSITFFSSSSNAIMLRHIVHAIEHDREREVHETDEKEFTKNFSLESSHKLHFYERIKFN